MKWSRTSNVWIQFLEISLFFSLLFFLSFVTIDAHIGHGMHFDCAHVSQQLWLVRQMNLHIRYLTHCIVAWAKMSHMQVYRWRAVAISTNCCCMMKMLQIIMKSFSVTVPAALDDACFVWTKKIFFFVNSHAYPVTPRTSYINRCWRSQSKYNAMFLIAKWENDVILPELFEINVNVRIQLLRCVSFFRSSELNLNEMYASS